MREVEAKIVLGDCTLLEALEERLKRLGAAFIEEKEEHDTYYQHPCRDFAKTDEALRIRETNGTCTLTYKGPKTGGAVKARFEASVRVDDCQELRVIIERLGFKPVAVVSKKRRYWRLRAAIVTLDEVEELGCFVEVESTRGREEDVVEVIKLLGLEGYPSTTKSYLEMLLEKRRSRF